MQISEHVADVPNIHRQPPHGGWTPSPNFVVKLRLSRRAIRLDDVAAFLDFWQWTDACDTVVWFWESHLSGGHDFKPELISNVLVPSDRVEIKGCLRRLFASHVKGLMEGKEVKRWEEIGRVARSLSRPLPIQLRQQEVEKRKGLEAEKKLVEGRIKEFGSAMECILQ